MYDELKKILTQSDNIVFFGGAGVSTESNIPDFRSIDRSIGIAILHPQHIPHLNIKVCYPLHHILHLLLLKPQLLRIGHMLKLTASALLCNRTGWSNTL